MAFGLVQHIKARTRSVQIDKNAAFDVAGLCPVGPGSQPSRASHRLSSLSIGDENRDPLTPTGAVAPATIRRYRSMLEVEDPPKLSPWKPMSFEELYSGPMQDPVADENTHGPEIKKKTEPRKQLQQIANGQTQESTSQATLSLVLSASLPPPLCLLALTTDLTPDAYTNFLLLSFSCP